MKLTRSALLTLIVLPASVGCAEADSGDDTSTSNSVDSTGSMTGSTSTGTTTDTGTSTDGSGSSTAPTATGSGTGSTTADPGAGGAGGAGDPGAGGGAGDPGAGGGAGDPGAGGGAGDPGAGGAGDPGAGGAGGGDEEISADTLLPGLDGMFWAFRTTNNAARSDNKYWLNASGEECPVGADWATSGFTVSKEFQAGGTPGQQYTVNFELRGALSLRCYADGTPTAMAPDPMGVNEAFYVGGQQFGDSPVNTLELAVTPAVADATASTYFLNGIPSTSDACDEPITYEVAYKAQFVIMGDSMVTLSSHASDCQALENCGADPAGAGCDPRTVNVEGVEVRASPMQPIFDYIDGADVYPQWLVFDIQSITSP